MEYWEVLDLPKVIKKDKKSLKQKRQERLDNWLTLMARDPNISVVAIELQRRKEQAKINKLRG